MVLELVEELSKNLSCNWKINCLNKPQNDYNIISVCFFYKRDAYKSRNIYIKGITNIIKRFTFVLRNFRLRIYHDNTTATIINELINKMSPNIKNKIETFEYDIPFFRDPINKEYHVGTIGTIIRFLPLYDNKLHKVNNCMVFDIDNYMHMYYQYLYNYQRNNNKIQFYYRSRFCYTMLERISCISDKKMMEYPIIASYIYQSIQLPYSLLENFFEDLYFKKDTQLLNDMKLCKIENEFEYGIDEYYMNKIHLKYFYDNHLNIAPIYNNYYDILSGLNTMITNIDSTEDITIYLKFIKKLFSFIENDIILESNITKNVESGNIDAIKKDFDLFVLNNDSLEKKINNLYNDKNKIKEIIDFLSNARDSIKLKNISILIDCIINNFNYIDFNFLKIKIIDTKTNKSINDKLFRMI